MDEEDSLYDEIFNQNRKTPPLVSDIEYLQENIHCPETIINKVKLATLENEKFKSQNTQLKKQVSSLKMKTLELSKRNTELEENLKVHAVTFSEEIDLADQEVTVLRAKLIDELSSLEEEQPWELFTKPKAYLNNNTGNRQFIRKKISLENKNARKVKIENCNSGNRQFVRKRKPVSDLKPKVPKLLNSKTYSDSYGDSCIVVCSICGEHMPIVSMRWHTSSLHHLSITKYKEECGGQLTFVRIAFHLCKLCGKEIQLDKDSIASHVREAHKLSARQYNQQFMINTRRRAGQAGDGFSAAEGNGEHVESAVKHHDVRRLSAQEEDEEEEDEEDDEEEEDGGSDYDDDSHGSNDHMGGGENDGDNYGADLSSSGSGTPSTNLLDDPDDKVNGDEVDDLVEDVGGIFAGDDDSWEWEENGGRITEDDDSWDWENIEDNEEVGGN